MTDFLGLAFSPVGAAGTLALMFALAFCLYALVSGVLAGRSGDARLEQSTRMSLWANFLFVSVALGTLEYAILSNDFTVRYVAEHSMSVSPTWVKVVTLWAALEGSILLWAWVLSLYAFLLSLTARRDVLRPWVLAVMALSLVNGAQALLLMGPQEVQPQEAQALERVWLAFEGRDERQLQAARIQWKAVTAAGLAAQYWNDESGRWEEKAESAAKG